MRVRYSKHTRGRHFNFLLTPRRGSKGRERGEERRKRKKREDFGGTKIH